MDPARYELRRDGRVLKLERIPMELLILLAEKQGNVASRQEIIDRLWSSDVFVDTELGINTAIRKIRAALREDAQKPRCNSSPSSIFCTPTRATRRWSRGSGWRHSATLID